MASAPAPATPDVLRKNYLSSIENIAQSIGTMGPVATLGTTLPLLIYKSNNGTWLLFAGVLVAFILIARNINVFAGSFASAGSLSAYTEAGLGRWAGSLAGWAYMVAMFFVVTSSALSVTFYVAVAATHFSAHTLSATANVLITLAVVFLAWWPSHYDIKFSTKLMLTIEAVSLVVIGYILITAMFRTHQWVDHAQLHLEGAGFSQYQLGFVLAFMTLSGFESMTTLGEEAKSATSTLPRAMLFCLLPVALLFMAGIYCLTALGHHLNLALDQAAAPIDLVAQSVGMPTLGWLSSVGVAVSCYGCALGGFNAGSRVLFSMARSRQISPYFEAVHPKNGTPHRALALLALAGVAVSTTLLYCGLSLGDSMGQLLELASLGFIGSYLAVCVAAPFYANKRAELKWTGIADTLVTVVILGAALILTIIPVPPGPEKYLPYIFVALVVAGMVASRLCRGKGEPEQKAAVAPAV